MPRFVVLEHDHPTLHWDWMLEAGDSLRTWRLERPPEPGVAIYAEPLPDHRRIYLDYEGPVSGNRGTVKRWDAGTFITMVEEADRFCLLLEGARLKGQVEMRQIASAKWQFIYRVAGEREP